MNQSPHRGTWWSKQVVLRGLLACGALAAAYLSVAHSMALAIRDEAPARAYGLAPWDGRVTASFAMTQLGASATPADRSRADRLARAALRMDPTSVVAVSVLGLNAQLRNDTDNARRTFMYAEMLSRRDLPTRLWAIEDAVSREDVPAALRNYDLALRVKPSLQEMLFPILTTAMSDDNIRRELVLTLAKKPLWSANFIDHVAVNGEAKATFHLLVAAEATGVSTSETARDRLIRSLIASNEVALAWRFYGATYGYADARQSRDPRFTAVRLQPTLFDWQPVTEDIGTAATITPGTTRGTFDFGVPPTVGGTVLRQMQVLPPGKYTLKWHSTGVEQGSESRPYWLLSCLDGRELGRIDVPNSSESNGRASGSFPVPDNCPTQYLSLIVRPSSQISGVSGQIDYVSLRASR